MQRLLSIAVLTGSIALGAATSVRTNFEPAHYRFAHRDAQLLAGIEWKAMQSVSSDAGQWKLIGEMLGNVDRLLISSPVSGERGKSPAHMLVIASGRFDLGRLQRAAATEGAVMTVFKGVQLIGPAHERGDEIFLAYVDARTALLGTKAVITAALDRALEPRTGPMAEENELYATASDISQDNDFWLVSNVSAEARKDPAFVFHKVSGFASGYKLDNGINYSIHINTDDQQSAQLTAKKLDAALAQVNAYFPGALPTRPGVGVKELIANMKVSFDDSDIHAWSHVGTSAFATKPHTMAQLTLLEAAATKVINTETIMRAIRSDAAALSLPALPSMPNVAPPPVKRVVRIEGLEDGIREIPYKPKKSS